jgi:hypothetical protein
MVPPTPLALLKIIHVSFDRQIWHGAVIADLADFSLVMRGKDYTASIILWFKHVCTCQKEPGNHP